MLIWIFICGFPMKKIMPGRYLFAVMLFVLSVCGAAGQTLENDQDLPSLELLEFLGEWETENGEWIDPVEMDQINLPEQEKKDSEQ